MSGPEPGWELDLMRKVEFAAQIDETKRIDPEGS